MGLYDNLHSARQVNDVMRQFAEQQEHENRMMQASIARKEKMIDAQLSSAEDVRKMLEMMEASQKEQAIEGKKTKLISIWGLVISGVTLAATIIFGILQVIR